jgi:hypothetical protein
MRVSSLSDERIIRLLSRSFVSVWLSRDHYQMAAPAKAERAELDRLDRERGKRKMPGGTVCVFAVAADGRLLATLAVHQASKPENLLAFLEKIVADQRPAPRPAGGGGPAVAPLPRPVPPGKLRLSIWARYTGGPNRGFGSDSLDLDKAEWSAFVPDGKPRVGASWKVDEKVTNKLFQLCYPPGPHYKAADCKVVAGRLDARVVAVSAAEVRIELKGQLALRYPYSGAATDGRVSAKLFGIVRYDRRRGAITSLRLASEEASYVWYWQGKPQPMKLLLAIEND